MAADADHDDLHREMQVRFDADELTLFFDAFAPLESPFEPASPPPDEPSAE